MYMNKVFDMKSHRPTAQISIYTVLVNIFVKEFMTRHRSRNFKGGLQSKFVGQFLLKIFNQRRSGGVVKPSLDPPLNDGYLPFLAVHVCK